MKTTEVSPIIFEIFSDFFRQHVHLLVAWGYDTVKPQMKTEDEEEITDLLYQGIQQVLCLEKERWCSNYAVKNEDPISRGIRKGKKRREIDLVIEFVTTKGRPQYIFEAKPLNYDKPYQRSSNYINDQAIGRFLQGEYADYTAHYPEVSMLGYVLSNSIEYWCDVLKGEIDKKKVELRVRNSQQDVLIIDEFPVEWISEHDRDSSDKPLMIYHILLDCKTQA